MHPLIPSLLLLWLAGLSAELLRRYERIFKEHATTELGAGGGELPAVLLFRLEVSLATTRTLDPNPNPDPNPKLVRFELSPPRLILTPNP